MISTVEPEIGFKCWGVGPRHKGREFEAWLKLTQEENLGVLAMPYM